MKVLFVADVHGSEQALGWVGKHGGSYDSIVVGGDLARKSLGFADAFLTEAASTCQRVFFVHGNWDAPETPMPEGVVALHGKTDMLGEYKIGGLGGSNPTPFNGPFEMADEEARAVLDGIGHVDILASHSPPARTKCDKASSGHIGSVPVREYIERERPRLVLSGHVHESRAVDMLGESTVVNPGPISEGHFAELLLNGIVSVELKTSMEIRP